MREVKQNTPKIPQRPNVGDAKKPVSKFSQKTINEDIPIKSQPKTAYINQLEEAPLSKKQDFFALLER